MSSNGAGRLTGTERRWAVPDLSTSNWKDATADSWQVEGRNIKLIRRYRSQPSPSSSPSSSPPPPTAHKLSSNVQPYHLYHCKSHIANTQYVGLRAGYLSVRMAGGASDRHWLKARCINGLTYLQGRFACKHILLVTKHAIFGEAENLKNTLTTQISFPISTISVNELCNKLHIMIMTIIINIIIIIIQLSLLLLPLLSAIISTDNSNAMSTIIML